MEARRLLTFVNFSLHRMASMLNTFTGECDRRLHEVSMRLDRLDASLTLVEAKLTSCHWLRAQLDGTPSTKALTEQNVPALRAETQSPPVASSEQPMQPAEQSSPELAVVAQFTNRSHPMLATYYRMVQMGVPAAAVKLKMQSENIDGDLLE
jgi:WASH complex subunit CCDC53